MNYLLFLQDLRESLGSAFTTVLMYITDVAAGVVGMMVPALVYWCIDKRAGTYMVMSFSFAASINQTVKNIFCVYRPFVLDLRIKPLSNAIGGATGYSFPSGHVTMATSLYGSFAIWQRKRMWVVAVCAFMTLLTAFARNLFGVHTLWDVSVAMLMSLAVIFAVKLLLDITEKKPKYDVVVSATVVLLTVILLAFIEFKSYPVSYRSDGSLLVDPYDMKTDCYKTYGILLGSVIGWLAERRFVKFRAVGKKSRLALRFAVGVVLLLALYLGILPVALKPLGDHWGKFLKYFITFITLMFIYPAVFTAFEKKLYADWE